MKSLKVCFVGYGSIAKRHISNLYKLCKDKKIVLCIDVLRHSKVTKASVDEEFRFVNMVKYGHLNKDDFYDIIFITNPTSEHYKTLKMCKNNAKMFLLEKPACSYEDLNKMSKLNIDPDKVYVACPLRYKKIIQYLKSKVNLKKSISVRAICSSYLPNWRKGLDYTKTYSANKKLGGGVRLDLIHEWDYLQYLFGKPKDIIYKYDKVSNLKINTEDIAIYIAEYRNKFIELHVDYFGRVYQRKFDIYFNDEIISVDLYKNTIRYLIKDKEISFEEERDDFQIAELEHFIDICSKNIKNDNNLNQSINTINLTRGKI